MLQLQQLTQMKLSQELQDSATIIVRTHDGNKTVIFAVTVFIVANLLLSNTSFESETDVSFANGAWTGITGWDTYNSGYNHI